MEFKDKWEVFNTDHIGCTNVAFGRNDGFTGYVEVWHHYFENQKKAKEVALLISKAPEMIEMLINILEYRNVDDSEIRQLIKEATGI